MTRRIRTDCLTPIAVGRPVFGGVGLAATALASLLAARAEPSGSPAPYRDPARAA